ncbi:restriction endonuclease subunit S [Acinetobacter courvalinii]|uniref:restriction endonuclease subunit S n=1 Tax=Acinetobacter courvalinii TaxID=280147 RepID=UPI003A844DA0
MNIVNFPEEWCLTNLGNVLELKYGKSLPASKRDDGKFPVYGSNGIVGGHSEPLVKTEGIIVGRKGSYGEVHISNSPFFPIDTTYYVDNLFNQPLKYWFYQLKTLPLTELNRSTAIPGLNREDAYSQYIALPPLAEQKVIADKLDILLAQVEATKVRLERILNILKAFRQSVLTAAISGKLTEEWRQKNSTQQVKLHVEKHNQNKRGLLKVRGKTGWNSDVDFFELPDNWAWIENHKLAIDEANAICAGPFGTIFKAKDFREEGVPIIFLRHVKESGFNQNKPTFMDIDVWKEWHQDYSVFGGELLVTKLGDPPGECCIFPEGIGVAMVTPDVLKMNVDTKVANKEYLKYFFNSPTSKKMVAEAAFGATRQRIDLSLFKLFPIPLPPVEEQGEIVRRVKELFTFAENIEQKVNIALERVNDLPQSILGKAFCGDLTADWRAANQDLVNGENSAEALLGRIKMEFESIEREPKPKRSVIKDKKGSRMSKKIIKVVEALKQAGRPLSGQQLLGVAGYPSDSDTDQLEQFFLDIRDALTIEKSIVKLERDDVGQDWFALAEDSH